MFDGVHWAVPWPALTRLLGPAEKIAHRSWRQVAASTLLRGATQHALARRQEEKTSQRIVKVFDITRSFVYTVCMSSKQCDFFNMPQRTLHLHASLPLYVRHRHIPPSLAQRMHSNGFSTESKRRPLVRGSPSKRIRAKVGDLSANHKRFGLVLREVLGRLNSVCGRGSDFFYPICGTTRLHGLTSSYTAIVSVACHRHIGHVSFSRSAA